MKLYSQCTKSSDALLARNIATLKLLNKLSKENKELKEKNSKSTDVLVSVSKLVKTLKCEIFAIIHFCLALT
jgi:hypothetical protein